MTNTPDARVNGAAPTYEGGKVLQRLLYFLGKRDPELNDEVLVAVPVSQAAHPSFGISAAARAGRLEAPRAEPRSRASEAYALRLMEAREIHQGGESAARAAAPGAAAAPSPPPWQALGPSDIPNGQTYGTNRVDVIGRVGAIAIDPHNPQHILCGSAGGGVWESKDDGVTWSARMDAMPSLAIGAVAFDPQNSKIVYAGSGEGNFYSQLGAGVYRSNDGGTTWTVLAKAPFIGVGFFDLVVDPKVASTLYAATTAGFFLSSNSGTSWALRRSGRCWDISVHPQGGNTEILATFTDGLFVSTNAGGSFTQVALPTSPAGAWSRLAVDRVVNSPDVTYIFGANGPSAHLWRRAGPAWSKITAGLPPINVTQAWYDWFVAAPPDKKDCLFIGAIDTWRGKLTGTTWNFTNISTQGNNSIHPDQHCLAFSPGNSNVIYAGNDGGLFRSPDEGASWKARNKGLGITEVVYMGSDPTTSNWLMAGLQDNGTIAFTGSSVWTHIADGDGGDCGVNQTNSNEIYHSFYNVTLQRSNDKGNTWTTLSPPASPSIFYPPVEVFNSTVAIGATDLLISRNDGASWTTQLLGGIGLCTAMHMPDANTILLGTQTGNIRKALFSGSTWSVASLASPLTRYVSCIVTDPSAPKTVWLTTSQFQAGAGMVWRSTDGGATWQDRTANLPHIPLNSVVVDPANSQRVWVAADAGVFQTLDGGASWSSFSTGLPNAMAAHLLFHKADRKLLCGTRNRGCWFRSIPVQPAVA